MPVTRLRILAAHTPRARAQGKAGPVPQALRIAYAVSGNQKLRRAAAWSSIAGSLLTRFGWVHAGRASARDHRIPLELPENAAEVRKSSHQIALQKPA